MENGVVYTIEREYLAKCSVEEMIQDIIQKHLSTPNREEAEYYHDNCDK